MITKDGYDRIEYLREIVNDGEEAQAVLKFVRKYREQVEQDTLKLLLKEVNKDSIAEAVSDYKSVVRFCELLENIISTGERKEKALVEELKK